MFYPHLRASVCHMMYVPVTNLLSKARGMRLPDRIASNVCTTSSNENELIASDQLVSSIRLDEAVRGIAKPCWLSASTN